MQSSRRIFWRVCAASVFGFASLSCAFSPTLPLYARSLGASTSELGLLMGIAPFAGIFIRLPAGAMSTIYGRRRLLIAGSLIFALAPLLLVVGSSLWMVATICFLYGFATLYMPAAIALVYDLFDPKDAVTYLGLYTMFSGIGRAIGPKLGGYVIFHFGYPSVFALCCGLGVISFLITLTIRSPVAATSHSLQHVFSDLRRVVTDGRLVTASFARLFQTLALGVTTAFFPIYGKEVAGLDADQIGNILGVQSLVALATRPLAAVLSTRTGRIPIMSFGMVLGGLMLFLVTQFTGFWPLFAVCSVIGVSEAACQIATVAYVADVAGKKLFGAAIGIVGSMFDVGLVLGRIIPGGLLPTALSWSGSFGLVGAVVALSIVPVALFMRGHPTPDTATLIDS